MIRHRCIYLIFLLLLTVCQPHHKQEVTLPQPLQDGWAVSSPEKEGFDQNKLHEVISNIPAENPKLDGLVIARHGKLVVDAYFNNYSPEKLHKIWSITKPVTGLLIGIAAEQNKLSVTDSIYQYLSGPMQNVAPAAKAITIEHLLTMTSGYKWEELGGPGSAGFQMPYSKNWIEFVLNQPHLHPPGTVYNYSTGNTVLLAPILEKVSQKRVNQYAKEYLFDPLGIEQYGWDTHKEFWTKTQSGELPGAKVPTALQLDSGTAGLTNTGSGLHLRPRDLCKFGQLMLNKGKWKDKQIINENWVKLSTQPHFGNKEYGYLWRLTTISGITCFYASGFGLQGVYVFPKLDLVITCTQQHYQTMQQGNKATKQLIQDILNNIEN